MRRLNYKMPRNKKEAIKFVLFLDSEWSKCLDVRNKRDRCKKIMKIHRTALDCMNNLKQTINLSGKEKMISIIKKWLSLHRLSDV